ncbi:MAG: phosphatase PAP2 family protein [Proteobacteria bacterium]|nr:phosphatase PAP2 family protein [Pseudomonadota bacterium]MBU1742773.1 phosphatase PAP2 family protein [Pseudomonadota bacterium]
MGRGLLKITAVSALATVAVIAALFLFADRSVDLVAHGLKKSFWYEAGQTISLLANHMLFNTLLFIGLVLAGIVALGRGLSPWVRSLLFVCLAVATAMIVGDGLKWFFGRYRPEILFEQGQYGFSFFGQVDSQHSFPSGHTLRIFSAMTAMSLLWPRARIPLLGVAVLVGVSRVVVTRHFPSDVVAGAFIGVFCALWVWRIMRVKTT